MTRSRASARDAGTRTETLVAGYLATHVDDRIERRTRNGTKDRGDIGGLRHMGQRIVIEVKDTARWTPSTWLAEAELERCNDDAGVGIVVCKRIGKGAAADQLVMLTLADLVSLLTGTRPGQEPRPHAPIKIGMYAGDTCAECGENWPCADSEAVS